MSQIWLTISKRNFSKVKIIWQFIGDMIDVIFLVKAGVADLEDFQSRNQIQ